MSRLKRLLSIIAVLFLVMNIGGCGGGDGGGATLTSIAVTPANPSITVGTTQQFTATGTYSDSTTQDLTTLVTWNSSAESVATINNTGLATAVSLGSTTITATSGSISGNTTLTVTSGAGLVSLPKTGQTTSYATGDDGELEMGVAWPTPRFTDNGDGTVTDNLTGLVWLQNANCFGTRSWAQALSDANSLASGGCGLTDGSASGDWRLPNRKELRSLIDYSKNLPALPSGHPFQNVQSLFYYGSSSTYADDTGRAWFVYMWNGSVDAFGKAPLPFFYVWPVRSGDGGAPADLPRTGQTTSYATGDDGDLQKGVAWPVPRFTNNGNGTVTDNLTGLVWLKNANCFGAQTWAQALSDANSLANGSCGLTDGSGAGDWRLPNVNELESLINAEEVNTATWLNGQGFTNVQSDGYWSSSAYALTTGFAWDVRMWDGVVRYGVKAYFTYGGHVWPVRAGQ